ncbi:uncharacterized protein LOC9320126 isoform X1 [Arabidopsis lyrata subsp. lyrata]|uniref:uncharacterized protein LOC9320126 isoform X1 n=1 Tax=Arabidopsis lyrata subsp. lyrata TaxID=81972 RepID=UPI000A29DD8B|nr:uncharacterized protein LOC9320126 isoform X1 [Arabidopsis lyrata subsp. lyrata]|eukprot:XP_020889266.1 uncharacterized protein LOC9320126 isoform X1 [Arabidopsis lyrata subsp. lyrata]
MKKGIFGRAFANAPIFALGYFTNDALTPNLNKKIKQVEQVSKKCFFFSFFFWVCVKGYSYRLLTFQVLAKAESLGHTYKAELAKVEKREKIVNRLIQRCEVLLFELEKKEKKLDDLGKLYRAPRMDVLKEKEKKLDYLGQLYRAPRMDVLKEMKNADGRYAGRN